MLRGSRGVAAALALLAAVAGFAVVAQASFFVKAVFAIAVVLLVAGAIGHLKDRWSGPFQLGWD